MKKLLSLSIIFLSLIFFACTYSDLPMTDEDIEECQNQCTTEWMFLDLFCTDSDCHWDVYEYLLGCQLLNCGETQL